MTFWGIVGRIGYDSVMFIKRAMGRAKRSAFAHFIPWRDAIKEVSDSIISTDNTKPPPHPPVKPHKRRMLMIGEGEIEYREEKIEKDTGND